MEASDLAYVAEELLAVYREVLLVDPFFKIDVEITKGEFFSECKSDTAPLSWKLVLNPERHEVLEDVRHSVVEGIISILFSALDVADEDKRKEIRSGLISRLSTAISDLLPVDLANEEEPSDIFEEV